MNRLLAVAIVLALTGCDQLSVTSGDMTSSQLEAFLRKHKVDNHNPVALKKRSVGGDSYLATVHGYPNNLSVCMELVAPYNSNPSLSVLPGTYFCEELR